MWTDYCRGPNAQTGDSLSGSGTDNYLCLRFLTGVVFSVVDVIAVAEAPVWRPWPERAEASIMYDPVASSSCRANAAATAAAGVDELVGAQVDGGVAEPAAAGGAENSGSLGAGRAFTRGSMLIISQKNAAGSCPSSRTRYR